MPHTYFVPSPNAIAPGQPWGERSVATGNPSLGISQVSTLTITGTPAAATTQEYEATVAPTIAAGDLVTIDVDGTFVYRAVPIPGESDSDIATELASAVSTGDTFQVQHFTFSGTPTPIATETYAGAITGTIDVGDSVGLMLDAVPYSYVALGGETPTDMAVGLVAACAADLNYTVTNVGPIVTIESQTPGAWAGTIVGAYFPALGGNGAFSPAETIAGVDADVTTLTTTGGVYPYTTLTGDTLADVATELATLAVADTDWTVVAAGAVLWVKSKTAGVIADCTCPCVGVMVSTPTTDVIGDANPQAFYNATAAAEVVTVTSATAGATAHVVTVSGTEISIVETTTGEDANVAAVDDGTTTFSYTVLAGNTNANIATALAALINADPLYVAAAVGTTITITGATPAAFSFTDATTNNQAPGTTITYALVTTGGASVLPGSTGYLSLSAFEDVTVWCELVSGTSWVATVWFYDLNTQLWVATTPLVVNAAVEIIQPNVAAIGGMFVEMGTFVGAAVGLCTIVGRRSAPGYNS